jgi:transcriptional regulator with XRE-family HTH domain
LSFGTYVRKAREELLASAGGSFSLRSVAERLGVNHTYLSKIERDEVPPSEEVVIALARELNEDPDVLLALAGKVSKDLLDIIRSHPKAFAALIRELRGRPEEAIDRLAREVRDGDW